MEYIAAVILLAGVAVWWYRHKRDLAATADRDSTGEKVLADLERGVPEQFLAAIRKSDMATVDLVIDSLDGYGAEVRGRVVQLLEQEGLVDGYIMALRGKDVEQKKAAVRKLAMLGSTQAVMPLVEAIADKNEEVRLLAAGALKRIKDPAGIGPLIKALKEPMKWLPARIAEVLVALGPLAVPALLAALHDPDPEYKSYIIEILGEIGDRGCLSRLVEVMQDENAAVRVKAVAAMGNFGGDVVEPLLAALMDSDKKVRSQTVLALRRIADPAAAAGLAGATGDPDKFVRTNAVEALGRLGDAGMAALQQIAGNHTHPEKDRAAAVLKQQGVKKQAKVNILYE